MKKLSLMGLFALMVLAACNEKKETPMPEAETVETPVATPAEVAPAEPTPAAKEEKGTTIKISSDGVQYSDKNTEVEISSDKKN